jgi:hypothetical protein
MKNIAFYLMTVAILLTTACISDKGRVTGVTLDQRELSLFVGQSQTLKATVMPGDALEKTVYWESDNTNIATVNDKGLVTGVATGNTRINVTTKESARYASCDVEVRMSQPVEIYTTVTDVTSTSATLGGNITIVGEPAYTERGVCYATTSNPTTANRKVVVSGTGWGSFSVNVSGLTEGTKYYARAYAINATGTTYGNEVSFVPGTVVAFTETFETGSGTLLTGWTFENGNYANRWHVGTATAYASSRSCYISNNSSSNVYSINYYSVVHFYRDFNITSTASDPAIISFYWKGNGESCCDYLSVHLVAASVTPIAGSTLSDPLITLSGNNSWQLAYLPLPVMSGVRRLVFTWRNDSYGWDTQPPAAVDNIMITNAISN